MVTQIISRKQKVTSLNHASEIFVLINHALTNSMSTAREILFIVINFTNLLLKKIKRKYSNNTQSDQRKPNAIKNLTSILY